MCLRASAVFCSIIFEALQGIMVLCFCFIIMRLYVLFKLLCILNVEPRHEQYAVTRIPKTGRDIIL